MRNFFWLKKAFTMFFILLGMYIALAWISGAVSERRSYQESARARVAESHPGQQTLIGPVLVIPYEEHYLARHYDEKGKLLREEPAILQHEARFFPEQMNVDGQIAVSTRKVGIHPVRVYGMKGSLHGQFGAPDENQFQRTQKDSTLRLGKPYVILAMSDVRGFAMVPRLKWGEQLLVAQPGTNHSVINSGVHFPLSAQGVPKAGESIRFHIDLDLAGMQSLAIVPSARDNHVTLASRWPHPSFSGRFLPRNDEKKITAEGFSAGWSVPALATNAQRTLRNANKENEVWSAESIQVEFVDPINVYSLSWRANEYGMLFILIAFAAFFLFEVLKRLQIHAIQYAFVGAAQAIFFLLLLALSEQIAFWLAYTAAAAACLLLIAVYLQHVLQSIWRSLGFTVLLGTLYGLLYGILSSEDAAFLMGSILLFVGLAIIMLVTRKIDWHQFFSGQTITPAALPTKQQPQE